MAEYQRGSVRFATFVITYPDGSEKTLRFDDASDITKIAFTEDAVNPADVDAFNVSDSDWRLNPGMLVYRGDVHTEGGGGGIPFCTHNGCKL